MATLKVIFIFLSMIVAVVLLGLIAGFIVEDLLKLLKKISNDNRRLR
jgi:hypothetical protein